MSTVGGTNNTVLKTNNTWAQDCPRLFTKVQIVLIAFLETEGICVFPSLSDILLPAGSDKCGKDSFLPTRYLPHLQCHLKQSYTLLIQIPARVFHQNYTSSPDYTEQFPWRKRLLWRIVPLSSPSSIPISPVVSQPRSAKSATLHPAGGQGGPGCPAF